MKALNMESVSYSGVATLALRTLGTINQFTMCNSGTRVLMDALAAALCGYNISSEIPAFIDLVDADGKSVLNALVPLVNGVYGVSAGIDESVAESCATFDGVITSGYKKVDNPTSVSIVLRSKRQSELARIVDDSEKSLLNFYSRIDAVTDGLVTWKLNFTNASPTNT